MAHKGVIIVKHADRGIPGEFLRKVLENNPICFGAAVADVRSDGTPELMLARSVKPGDLKDILDTVDTFKSRKMIYHFGDYPQGFHEDDVQPFTVLNNPTGDPALVAFFDGEYPGYVEEKSNRSDAWFVLQKFLIPTVNQYLRMVGGDFTKLLDELRNPTFVNTIHMLSPGRSTVTLFPVTGEILTYAKNENKREFGWGWTSNHYGYVEVENKETPKTEASPEPKPNKLVAALKVKLTGSKPVVATLPTPKPVVEQAPIITNPGPTIKSLNEQMKEASSAVADVGKPDGDFVMLSPPAAECISKNQIRNWYFRHCPEMKENNTLPEGYKKRPAVPVKKARLAEIVEQDKKRKAENRSTSVPQVSGANKLPAFIDKTKYHETRNTADPVKPAGDTMAKHVEEPAKIFTQPVLDNDGKQPPIIPAAERQKITETFINRKHLDKGSQEMMDPKKIQKIESKWPPFTQQMGLSIEETLNWDEPDLKVFQENHPDSFRMLAIEWRNTLAAKLVPVQEEVTTVKPVVSSANNNGKIKIKLNSGTPRNRVVA